MNEKMPLALDPSPSSQWRKSSGASPAMEVSIAARLERLPVCSFHRKFVTLIAVGAWYEVFDLFVTAYLGAALQHYRFLTLEQFSFLVAAGFVGMYLGTNFLGSCSDYIGRRTAFISLLLFYSAFSIAGAFAPDANTLILLRFLAGIGIGGQLVIVDTYVSEIVPSASRGRYVAYSQLASFTSVPLAALITSFLVPTHWLMDGWRWVMIFGGSGAALAWILMRALKESPRWLESVGRAREAALIMDEIEDEVEHTTGRPLPPAPAIMAEVAHKMPFRELWTPEYRSRTIMLTIFQIMQTIGFYGFANWAPTFLLSSGRNLGQSLNFSFLFALMYPVGPIIGMLTTERFERKYALVLLSVLMAATGMLFAFAHTTMMVVFIGVLLTVFNSWFASIFHAYQAELFPTRARATGVGFTYGFSRISAVFSTILIARLLPLGIIGVFAFIGSAMLCAAVVVGLFGPKTNSIALEKISH
jgi:MFS transporter, putative metabolite:H+ symporter